MVIHQKFRHFVLAAHCLCQTYVPENAFCQILFSAAHDNIINRRKKNLIRNLGTMKVSASESKLCVHVLEQT